MSTFFMLFLYVGHGTIGDGSGGPWFLDHRNRPQMVVPKWSPKRHNRLWNGGNGYGTVKLYKNKDGKLVLIDEIEATHIGCEYGEYDK